MRAILLMQGVILLIGTLALTARVEKAECLRFFGNQYQDYMQRSKQLIPFIW